MVTRYANMMTERRWRCSRLKIPRPRFEPGTSQKLTEGYDHQARCFGRLILWVTTLLLMKQVIIKGKREAKRLLQVKAPID